MPQELRRAAELLERRWLLSIVYASLAGAQRFTEFRQAVEGAMVVCEAVKGPRGLQASRILSLDNSTAQVVMQGDDRTPRYIAEPHGPRAHPGADHGVATPLDTCAVGCANPR